MPLVTVKIKYKPLSLEMRSIVKKILRLNEEIDDLIENRYVARHGCFDNILCFIKKNNEEAYPYYVFRCQYGHLEKHKRWFKLCLEVFDQCDDPDAIHR